MDNLNRFSEITEFIWSIAELLRGDYKRSEYGRVILPLTVLRRLDCVLAPTREKVWRRKEQLEKMGVQNVEPILCREAGQSFYNINRFSFDNLRDAPNDIAANLANFINGFSQGARDIIDKFNFQEQIHRLDQANLLYLIVQRFAEIDLHPDKVSNLAMGYIFEELIRRFSEQSNETAGEHFTPREVIRLMVDILFADDSAALAQPGAIRTLYDPACGTGGMLSVAQEYLHEFNSDATLEVFGQEINAEAYAICKSDMMIKGLNTQNIVFGNSFTEDGLPDQKFDYMLSNPPFGVDWKKVQASITDEAEKRGYAGRFGAGLPRISDGSLLFLQHMLSKMKPEGSGTRLAIVFNGSPLFTGDAGSGESNIRQWIIENDWLEGVVALPEQLFYNTGIATYLWILTNRKSTERKGKVQLVNAVDFYEKMRKSLGNKRHEISQEQIAEITRIYCEFRKGPYSKIFANEDFGFSKIVVERPQRLNFQGSPERIARLHEETAFQNLAKSRKQGYEAQVEIATGKQLQEEIISALASLASEQLYKNIAEFEQVLERALSDKDLKLTAVLQRAIISALSERDETAAIVRDAKGNPVPDVDLRDYENVPLKEDIHTYFKREVLPHVPDAWIDETRTRIGYEIPFTRHFYKYEALRPLEEIDTEIRALEQEIAELLQGVIGNEVS